jgi:hypothetical protein
MRSTALLCLFLSCSAGFLLGVDAPKVFVTDSKSWEMSGGGGGTSEGFGGASRGGARPQTAEIIKTFGERCPDVTVNMKQEKADYVVVLEHEGGKGILRKDNKVAVFNNHDGDSIFSHSTASLGSSVKDACAAIHKHWAERGAGEAEAERAKRSAPSSVATGAPEFAGAKVQLLSNPPGADIEVDGNFVGSTPSSIVLPAGEHSIAVKKNGYKAWEKKIKVTAGEISLNAELEKPSTP